jgi:hypothetical protein
MLSLMRMAVEGRPGQRFAGASPGCCGSVCRRASCAWASVTAVWAARSLVAMGPATAWTSSGYPWHKAGVWCAARAGATEAHSPGASSLVDGSTRPWRGARAGAINACPRA